MAETSTHHSYAFKHDIHNHSDEYYQRMIAKQPDQKAKIEELKTAQRAAYTAYVNSPNFDKDVENGFFTKERLATYRDPEKHFPPLTQREKDALEKAASSAAGGAAASMQTAPSGDVGSSAAVSGSEKTKDGYTWKNALSDMTKLAAANGITPPDGKTMETLAKEIIKGVNANFSGKNGIGDYSKVSGTKMARTLIVSAFQESKFNTQGQDKGGVFQAYVTRIPDYNAKFGTNYSWDDVNPSDVSRASVVGTYCMAHPTTGMVGKPAGPDNPIPGDPAQQALYYWNYNPGNSHGHSNELSDYMAQTEKFFTQIGGKSFAQTV